MISHTVDVWMLRQRVPTIALLRLVFAAFLVTSGGYEWRGTSVAASCDGYACDVIVVTSSSNDSVPTVVTLSAAGEVPRDASELRLTLRRSVADGRTSEHNESGASPLSRLRHLRSLELDVSEMRSFPVGLLSTLGATSMRKLTLSRSASTHLSEYRLRLPTSVEGTFATSNINLSKLVLSNLGIVELPMNTFSGLTTLAILFLNDNRLSSLPSGLFDDLCQLSSLSLATNRFVDVRDLFLTGSGSRCGGGLARLQTLDLYGNRIRRLRAGAFQSLCSVVELNLSANQLTVIDAGAFSCLSELHTLYLDDNQLTVISPAMFDGLTGLIKLDIGRNRLSDIPVGAFRHLTALGTLDLYKNEIQTIGPDAWSGLDQLTKLDLSSNRLRAINASTFDGLCSLRQLDLSNNEMSVARADAFACLTALERLEMSDNLLPDAERQQLEQRQWLSNDSSAACDRCGSRSVTTPSPGPSSSAAARLGTVEVLAVSVTIGVTISLLSLTLAVAGHLVKRRRGVFDGRANSTCCPHHPRTVSTLDSSIYGVYVKVHT